ncbi:hypothetical protein BDZ45DRAFT_789772, partial [Acephala macrosclerotiorum]
RAEEADERAEQERRRAEDERKCAEDKQRNRQEVESRAQIEGKKTRSTIFEEYIRACYTLLSKPLRIQTDKSLSTQGSITSPKNKPCPTLLKPWTNFPLFERIYEYIPRDAELFSSIQYLKELEQDLCDRPLASEKDLKAYQRLAVERSTIHIISHLQQIEEARREFNLDGSIIFENYANTLNNSNKTISTFPAKNKSQNSNPKPRNANQICVYKKADGTRSLCIVVKYKPSHKLSVFNLRTRLLRTNEKSMNIPKNVINRITISTDLKNKFVYHSEWLTIAALTQTYAYIIENGLEYNKLITGEVDVFLLIKAIALVK